MEEYLQKKISLRCQQPEKRKGEKKDEKRRKQGKRVIKKEIEGKRGKKFWLIYIISSKFCAQKGHGKVSFKKIFHCAAKEEKKGGGYRKKRGEKDKKRRKEGKRGIKE